MLPLIHTLEADGIQLDRGGYPLLDNIYLRVDTGRVVAMNGRNGAGKSSLLQVIYGTLPAICRSVRIDGKSYPRVFQKPSLVSYLPQNAFLPRHLSLTRVFADYLVIHAPSWFSLLDEPFAQLDPLLAERVVGWLGAAKTRKGFLLTDHLQAYVEQVADETVLLENKRIIR